MAESQWMVLHRWAFTEAWYGASKEERQKAGEYWRAFEDAWKADGIEPVTFLNTSGHTPDGYTSTQIWRLENADQYVRMLNDTRKATELNKYVAKYEMILGWQPVR